MSMIYSVRSPGSWFKQINHEKTLVRHAVLNTGHLKLNIMALRLPRWQYNR